MTWSSNNNTHYHATSIYFEATQSETFISGKNKNAKWHYDWQHAQIYTHKKFTIVRIASDEMMLASLNRPEWRRRDHHDSHRNLKEYVELKYEWGGNCNTLITLKHHNPNKLSNNNETQNLFHLGLKQIANTGKI